MTTQRRAELRGAKAIDKLGDDAVREVAGALVTALRSEAEVAKVCAGILAARKTRVLTGLVRGLETDDEATHARRILELINALPDAGEVLYDAFVSPAENVQVNAAIGLGMLGASAPAARAARRSRARAPAARRASARSSSRRWRCSTPTRSSRTRARGSTARSVVAQLRPSCGP